MSDLKIYPVVVTTAEQNADGIKVTATIKFVADHFADADAFALLDAVVNHRLVLTTEAPPPALVDANEEGK